MTIIRDLIAVREVSVVPGTTATQVKVVVHKLAAEPSVPAPAAHIYQYVSIEVNTVEDIDEATIMFRVPTSWLEDKSDLDPTEPVFPLRLESGHYRKTSKMMCRDLERAGIPYRDDVVDPVAQPAA